MKNTTLIILGTLFISQTALAQGRPSMFNQQHNKASGMGGSIPRPMAPTKFDGATISNQRTLYQAESLIKTQTAIKVATEPVKVLEPTATAVSDNGGLQATTVEAVAEPIAEPIIAVKPTATLAEPIKLEAEPAVLEPVKAEAIVYEPIKEEQIKLEAEPVRAIASDPTKLELQKVEMIRKVEKSNRLQKSEQIYLGK